MHSSKGENAVNQSCKFKRGDKNESTGLVFYRYNGESEAWITPEAFEKKIIQDKERSKKHFETRDKQIERERLREFRRNNRGKERERAERYRKKNSEICSERSLTSRAKKIDEYREKEKARMIAFRARNRDQARAKSSMHEAARRAAIRSAKSPSHSKRIEMQLRLIASRIAQCLGVPFHVDHITPISRGGIHHHLNMRVIPARLNQIKYTRTDSECPVEIQKALKDWTL